MIKTNKQASKQENNNPDKQNQEQQESEKWEQTFLTDAAAPNQLLLCIFDALSTSCTSLCGAL